jgi:hypothetical protein
MARISDNERIERRISKVTIVETITPNDATDNNDCCDGLIMCDNCDSDNGE